MQPRLPNQNQIKTQSNNCNYYTTTGLIAYLMQITRQKWKYSWRFWDERDTTGSLYFLESEKNQWMDTRKVRHRKRITLESIRWRKLSNSGHTMRTTDDCPEKEMIRGTMDGSRSRGNLGKVGWRIWDDVTQWTQNDKGADNQGDTQ